MTLVSIFALSVMVGFLEELADVLEDILKDVRGRRTGGGFRDRI